MSLTDQNQNVTDSRARRAPSSFKSPNLGLFAEILRGFEFEPVFKWPWAICGNEDRVQGWKLHISVIPNDALSLLESVLPILKLSRVCFKMAATQELLASLNEGEIGSTQIGKFITIYPENDEQAVKLAKKLIVKTQSFEGPRVQTDLHLGGLIFARYGGFNPIVLRDRLGNFQKYIYDPDEKLIPDEYIAPPNYPSWLSNPFNEIKGNKSFQKKHRAEPSRSQKRTEQNKGKLFGPGYLILKTLKTHGKGSVFLGMDLRSQDKVALKVIKQGRKGCLTDSLRRDMRDRLKLQLKVHSLFSHVFNVPSAEDYFEVNGDGYLVLEHVEGQTLESLVVSIHKNRPWKDVALRDKKRLLTLLLNLLKIVEKFHKAGFVHRDLTASNIWISTNNIVHLLDLELVHEVKDTSLAFGLGTSGFMSPQQEQRKQPDFTDDIYAIGCVLLFILTGLDPRRILYKGTKKTISKYLDAQGNRIPKSVTLMIDRCLSHEPLDRPSLDEIKLAIQIAIGDLEPKPNGPEIAALKWTSKLSEVLQRGLAGLIDGTARDQNSGLWFSPALNTEQAMQGMATLVGDFEIRRSANRGVAGPCYVIGRLGQAGYYNKQATELFRVAAEWLLEDQDAQPDKGMPGLHFGDAGVAVALIQGLNAGIIPRNDTTLKKIKILLDGTLDWPDITHGAAGQGLAVLQCSEYLETTYIRKKTLQCVNYLLKTQAEDGSWEMPEGTPGMSGEILSGFAHGVAGMAYFLFLFSTFTKHKSAHNAALRSLDWLQKHKLSLNQNRVINWPYSNTNDDEWRWWCHGGPGIALAFLKGYQATGNTRYAEIARKALNIHPKKLLYSNLSTCHGLAGIGEIYLEAFQVLDDKKFEERAHQIGDTLIHLAHETENGSVVWLVEDPLTAFADLMVGSSGVLHFLLRLHLKNRTIGFPLLY